MAHEALPSHMVIRARRSLDGAAARRWLAPKVGMWIAAPSTSRSSSLSSSTRAFSSHGLFEPADSPFRAEFDGSFKLSEHSTVPPEDAPTRQELKRQLHSTVARIAKEQKKLLPSNFSLLLIFQAMDAAGKDSTISACLHGVNPIGCQVSSFRRPSEEDLGHDPLWRYGYKMPEKGMIGVFNRKTNPLAQHDRVDGVRGLGGRVLAWNDLKPSPVARLGSYYEKVLVLRVHPEFVDEERLTRHADVVNMPPCAPHPLWEERFQTINEQERYLARNGTIVLKFMLNVSKKMQARRFLRRIDDPSRNWKFSAADMNERQHWDQYQAAYQDAIAATSRPHAPWYVIPADSKPFMKHAVSTIIHDTLRKLDLSAPLVAERKLQRFATAREFLAAELAAEGLPVPVYDQLTKARDLEHDVGVVHESTDRSLEMIDELRALPWRQLSKGQRDAAKVLGFNQQTWDHNDEGVNADFQDLYWSVPSRNRLPAHG